LAVLGTASFDQQESSRINCFEPSKYRHYKRLPSVFNIDHLSRANTPVSSVDGVPAAGSCGSVVFVDRTGQDLSSHDDRRRVDCDVGVVARGSLISPLVRPVIVVVRFIDGQDLAEMAFAEDELLVQAFSAQGANESLGERVRARGLDRGFDDSGADGGEDSVEGSGELGVSVPDEELERLCCVDDRSGAPSRAGGVLPESEAGCELVERDAEPIM